MNQRRIVAVLLAFLLVLAGGALTAAQSDDASKVIPGRLKIGVTCSRSWISIGWCSPEKEPHSYRVSWTHGKRWRSLKQPNTKTAGNMILAGGNISYWPTGIGFPYLTDRTLRIRVRAIYKGEKNGPWNYYTHYSHC